MPETLAPGLPGKQVAHKRGMNAALEQAAALLHGAAETLSDESHTCICCGLAVYTNWSEYQLKAELKTIVRRLGKLQRMRLDVTQPNGRADG